MEKLSKKGTPCQKCHDGKYGLPHYVAAPFTGQNLVYTCDVCGHRLITPVKDNQS